MDLNTALVFFFLVAITFFIIARSMGVRFFSSLIFGLLIGYLVLIVVHPWQNTDDLIEGNFGALLYILICFLVPVLVIAYVILKVAQDRYSCVTTCDQGCRSTIVC